MTQVSNHQAVNQAVNEVRPRDYDVPMARSEDGRLIDILADIAVLTVQRVLESAEGGCLAAVRRLHRLQIENQFIRDRLSRMERRRVTKLDMPAFLVAQTNPERLNRTSSKPIPPPGIRLAGQSDIDTYIRYSNILWQQAGRQFPFRFHAGGEKLVAAVNPWPFGKNHTTVIWGDEPPQECNSELEIASVVKVMLSLAETFRGWLVLFNAMAGPSIPYVRHVHILELEPAQRPLPIQHAAARAAADLGMSAKLAVGTKYHPMPVFRFAGPDAAGEVVRACAAWRSRLEDATENLLAVVENDQPVIYLALRQKGLVKAPGLAGDVAALEVAGEFVLATESEIRAVREGSLAYADLASVLRNVTPWQVFEMFDRLASAA